MGMGFVGLEEGVTATPDPYGMTNKGTGNDSHKGNNNDNGSGHDKKRVRDLGFGGGWCRGG
jgi:hypothetical protein